MKRFNYDDEEDYKDEYFFPNDIDEDDLEEEEGYWHEINIEYAKLNIVKNEQDQKLLFRIIRNLQGSCLWNWKSSKEQTKEISEMFLAFKNLIDNKDEPQES